eukprot:2463624-Pleurochrysis_carterae.AAC.3
MHAGRRLPRSVCEVEAFRTERREIVERAHEGDGPPREGEAAPAPAAWEAPFSEAEQGWMR